MQSNDGILRLGQFRDVYVVKHFIDNTRVQSILNTVDVMECSYAFKIEDDALPLRLAATPLPAWCSAALESLETRARCQQTTLCRFNQLSVLWCAAASLNRGNSALEPQLAVVALEDNAVFSILSAESTTTTSTSDVELEAGDALLVCDARYYKIVTPRAPLLVLRCVGMCLGA